MSPTQRQDFDIEQSGSVVTVIARYRELSDLHMEQITGMLSRLIAQDDARAQVFDLGEVEFLDSACVARLIGLFQDVKNVDGQIALVNCQPNVDFLFKMSRLDSMFGLFDSVEEAVSSL